MHACGSTAVGFLIAGAIGACGGRVQQDDASHSVTGGGSFKPSSANSSAAGDCDRCNGGSNTGGTTPVGVIGTGGSTDSNAIVINDFSAASDAAAFSLCPFVCDSCYTNLAAGLIPEATVSAGWQSDIDADPNASPGSIVVNAVFTDWNQLVDIQMPVPVDANGHPRDLEHQRLTAKILVAQGLSRLQEFPFGAALYVRTGNGAALGASYWTTFDTLDKWYTLTMATDDHQIWWFSHPNIDPTSPHFLGIKFGTGYADERSYCPVIYSEPFGPPLRTVFYLDQIWIEP